MFVNEVFTMNVSNGTWRPAKPTMVDADGSLLFMLFFVCVFFFVFFDLFIFVFFSLFMFF